MCWSEKADSKVLKKFYMQKMPREYWRGSGAGNKVVIKWKLEVNKHILVTERILVEDVRLL